MQASGRWSAVWTPEKIEAINASFDDTYHHVRMEPTVCRWNLKGLRAAFKPEKIPFYLLFGTLLGAHRNKDFIPGDHDTDIGVLVEDVPRMVSMFSYGLLGCLGWKPIRVWDGLVSLARDGEYVDIYIFEDSPDPDRWWSCQNYYLEKRYLKPPGEIEFGGLTYQTVNDIESYLTDRYGTDWRTPANVQATK